MLFVAAKTTTQMRYTLFAIVLRLQSVCRGKSSGTRASLGMVHVTNESLPELNLHCNVYLMAKAKTAMPCELFYYNFVKMFCMVCVSPLRIYVADDNTVSSHFSTR